MLTVCMLGQASSESLEIRPLDEYGVTDRFQLHSGDLVVTIEPRSAFTIENIVWRGKQVTLGNGHYGMVVCFPRGEWVGTGHREGGVEEVIAVSLTVDGKPVSIASGAEISGGEIILTKQSLYRDNIQAAVKLTIRDNRIVEHVLVDFLGDTEIQYWYPFMYVWPITTTHWKALSLKGEQLSGKFENEGWKLQDDVRWTAVYDPKLQFGALTRFPETFPLGQGRRHAYWDRPVYHKQYFMAAMNHTFPAGTRCEFEVEVSIFSADSLDSWKKELHRLTEGD